MKIAIYINQPRAVEWGLTFIEAGLYSWFITVQSWAEKKYINGEVYYWAAKTKALEDMPILSESKKVDTVYRYYKKLEDKGLIKYSKIDGKDYVYLLPEKARVWDFEETRIIIRDSDVHPKNNNDSDVYPTYSNLKGDTHSGSASIRNLAPSEKDRRRTGDSRQSLQANVCIQNPKLSSNVLFDNPYDIEYLLHELYREYSLYTRKSIRVYFQKGVEWILKNKSKVRKDRKLFIQTWFRDKQTELKIQGRLGEYEQEEFTTQFAEEIADFYKDNQK